MKLKTILIGTIIGIILCVALVMAATFTPQGNIDMKNSFSIVNIPFINSINFTKFYNDFVSSNSTANSRIDSVNSSLNSINSTLQGNIDSANARTTSVNGSLTSINSTLQGNIDTANTRINSVNSTINSNNASWMSTRNATYESYVNANVSNSTSWWNGISGWLSTYFYKSGNSLELNETKLNNSIADNPKNWTSLQNYPIACPVGTYLTAINDSTTCESISVNTYDNLTVVKLNVTNITIGGHIIWENASGALIID